MEQAFESLKKEGKNSVDNLVKWMKDSKVIADSKDAEEKAKNLFQDASNKQNIELDKFKEALSKIAIEQKKSADDLAKTLGEQGPKILEGLMAGASAMKDRLFK